MQNVAKKYAFLGGVIALLVFFFLAGVYLGYNNRPEADKIISVINKGTPLNLAELDFEPFWKTWNIIESKYVSSGEINRQDLVWGAISGMVASLKDPYSVFMPPKEAEIFESSVRGNFEGVGMEVGMRNGALIVVAPLKGTPAEKAGLKPGDKILKIDKTDTVNLTVDEAVGLIRGPKGTQVVLTVLREKAKESIEIGVTRDVIQIPVLETEKKEKGIFVIKLYNFSAPSNNAFKNALQEMIESNSSKLIIDLRGNAGGYLESAVDIASWFLPAGEVVAREKFSSGEEKLYRSKGYNLFNEKLRMIILVNQGSASASEILAGALREHGKATLAGEKTFGKGSVQELMDISKGSSLKLTIAKWLTPQGVSITDHGLEPDVKIELNEKDFEAGRDPQMDKAVDLLKN